ncbi:olfactory receptor 226-like [Lissotriton helveticus]
MYTSNRTSVTAFLILGFGGPESLKVFLFLVILIVYMLIITTNVIIISVVWISTHLHTPMYFFLSNFSFMEIWYTTVTIPKMLQNFLPGQNTISVRACLSQCYMFFALGTTQCLLLSVMAVDRYLAICIPFHYPSIMQSKTCYKTAMLAWAVGFLSPLLPIIMISKLSFCGPIEIHHFFCDVAPLLKLSCSDFSVIELLTFVLACLVIISTFMLISVSYVYIIITILKIPSHKGRQKAFSTCSSHLTVVIIFYTTITFMYGRPATTLVSEMDKIASLFYTVLTPLFNPLIYSLRNQEVRAALRKSLLSSYFKAGLKSLH